MYRIGNDPDLGSSVDSLNVGDHDEEEIRSTESPPDLRFFEVDSIGFVPQMNLQLKVSFKVVDSIGTNAMLSPEVNDLSGISSQDEARQLHTNGFLVQQCEAWSWYPAAGRFRVPVGVRQRGRPPSRAPQWSSWLRAAVGIDHRQLEGIDEHSEPGLGRR